MQNNISNVIVFDEKISTYVFYTKVTKTFYDMYMSQRNTAPILDFRKTKYITPEAIPVLLSFGDYLSRLYKRKIQIVYTRGSELHNFFMVSKFYEISQKLDIFEWDDVSYEWYYKELRKLHKISYTNIIYADVEKIKEPMQKRDFISDCLRDRSKVIYQNVLSDTNKLPENIIGATIDAIVEIETNAIMYSQSHSFTYVASDRYGTKISIADSGIGFKESFLRNKRELKMVKKFQGVEKKFNNYLVIMSALNYSFEKHMESKRDDLWSLRTDIIKNNGTFKIQYENTQVIFSCNRCKNCTQINGKKDISICVQCLMRQYSIDTYSPIKIFNINSLAKESHLNHVGYVDLTKLDKEIQEYLGDDKNIFVVTHHSFTDTRERELASIKNVDTLRDALGLKRINTFIYGHHHTSESKKDVVGEQEYELRYIEIGSIGKILENVNGESYNNRFTVAICEQGKLCIHDYNYTAGEWEERNNQKYLNELSIVPKGKTEEVDSKDLPRAKEENSDHEKIDGQGKFPAEKEIYLCNRSEFLFEYLKKEGNYKEGHFHWKNKNKTLGWINIASFLGNIDILEKAKECIIEIFEKEMGDVQVVVGYGMEGNIIGSSLVDYWIENDKDYYFYPSVHKDNEHIDLEKSLWNEYNEYKNVLIICDMMPSMEYLAEILKSNTKLEACSKIYVLALFTNFNLLKQEQENKTNKIIRRYSLAKLNVPICEKDEENCLICKQNLGKIYSL